MGKEISRIRLNRLYSESNIFEEISFHDGVNIILGEKYDDSSVKGRKTNGVGMDWKKHDKQQLDDMDHQEEEWKNEQ